MIIKRLRHFLQFVEAGLIFIYRINVTWACNIKLKNKHIYYRWNLGKTYWIFWNQYFFLMKNSFMAFHEYLYVMHSHKGTVDILSKNTFLYHCKEHTFSFILIPKSRSYSTYFLRYNICVQVCNCFFFFVFVFVLFCFVFFVFFCFVLFCFLFFWKCVFEKLAFQVSYSYSFWIWQAAEIAYLFVGNVWKSV